jgi:hypothetical protein
LIVRMSIEAIVQMSAMKQCGILRENATHCFFYATHPVVVLYLLGASLAAPKPNIELSHLNDYCAVNFVSLSRILLLFYHRPSNLNISIVPANSFQTFMQRCTDL